MHFIQFLHLFSHTVARPSMPRLLHSFASTCCHCFCDPVTVPAKGHVLDPLARSLTLVIGEVRSSPLLSRCKIHAKIFQRLHGFVSTSHQRRDFFVTWLTTYTTVLLWCANTTNANLPTRGSCTTTSKHQSRRSPRTRTWETLTNCCIFMSKRSSSVLIV